MDSGSTPQGIGRGHPSDQGFNRGVDGRVARRAAPGERGPVAAKAASLPAQHSGGSHDDEGLPPGGPHSGQPDPKEPIAPLKLRPVRRPLVDGQLLPQGEVLKGELAVAVYEEGKESKQVEQESDHRAGILSGSEATDGEVLELLDNETGMHSCLEPKPSVAGWHRRQEEASPCPREYRHRSGRARSLMSC